MRSEIIAIVLFVFVLFSCETDSYEKGEGKYSLMQADLVDLTIDGQLQGVAFVTDDGDAYQLTSPFTAQWIEFADTTYRTILYYNKVEAGRAEVMGVSPVVTLEPFEHWRFKEQPQDPIGIESAWMAKSGKYLNLGLLMKTGRVGDEELPHDVGVAQDTVLVHPDQKTTAYYRFLHSQNGIPEYYTNRRYVSILLPQQRPDTIRFCIQTYEGVVWRVFTDF